MPHAPTGPQLQDAVAAFVADADNRVRSAEAARDRFLGERNVARVRILALEAEAEQAARALRAATTEVQLLKAEVARLREIAHKAP